MRYPFGWRVSSSGQTDRTRPGRSFNVNFCSVVENSVFPQEGIREVFVGVKIISQSCLDPAFPRRAGSVPSHVYTQLGLSATISALFRTECQPSGQGSPQLTLLAACLVTRVGSSEPCTWPQPFLRRALRRLLPASCCIPCCPFQVPAILVLSSWKFPLGPQPSRLSPSLTTPAPCLPFRVGECGDLVCVPTLLPNRGTLCWREPGRLGA